MRCDDEVGRCFTCNTRGKVWSGAVVQGDGNGAAQEAPPEGSHPFGTVRPPQKDTVPGPNAAEFKLLSTAERASGEFCITPGFTPVAAALDNRDVASIALEIGEQRDEIVSRHASQPTYSLRI